MRSGLLMLLALLFAPSTRSETAELRVETLAEGLELPSSVAELPDGRLLVSERAGRLRLWTPAGLSAPLAGLPKVRFAGQGGLLEVLPDRDFADNRAVYLSYAAGSRRANGTRLARATLGEAGLVDLREIFVARPDKPTDAHFGGRMAQLADGSLVLTLGDGFSLRESAQDLRSHLGKLVRVNPDGSVPADNPFVGREDALPEIYSLGHRNVQGIAFDPARATLWSHEHGPRGGDELNRIEPGQNYGWPVTTAGLDYSGAQISPFIDYPGMRAPVHGWTPSIAPSSLAVYRGSAFAQWQNDLLVTALAGRALHRLRLDADGRVQEEEVLLRDLGERLRDVRVDAQGRVLVLTDGARARLLRLSPAP
ncbi:PQQ-dependent sugar dehydrogenase [Aquimonas voraii]|uniref:Glucose/arabinose dehydrogenase, beta-propeller fold n=1 Tax=Aquimonas voraii TaxID=265719 RepID=A0A1G6WT94_9GAMM|nr:PQQ-dependent sugar dehydrogenase [Aquimonas voraii]SDD68316.1 Glucose/arabinose dehydrogenase, beta-propeller fold [Aquimonas voraii]